MSCRICGESNVGLDHEITEKHIRNRALYEYSLNRKEFAGNRKGIIVSCNAKSSFMSLIENMEAKVKISVKPNEDIKFNFKIKNDTNKEDVVVNFVKMMHTKLNFIMNGNPFEFGCGPVALKPKEVNEVSIMFKSPHTGQYDMPIVFSFRKPAANEGVVIMREMVVFVEERQTVHEKVNSPYKQKEVIALDVMWTISKGRNIDMFHIPKENKVAYASGLKARKDASEDEVNACAKIRNILSTGVTEENYVDYFHNLLWYEETVVRVNLKKYNMAEVNLIKDDKKFSLFVPGLSEKRPSLMLGDHLFVKPSDSDKIMFEAKIADIRDSVAIISGFDQKFEKYYSPEAKFDIRFFMSRRPLERMHQALDCVRADGVDQHRVFPKRNFKPQEVKPITKYFNPHVERNAEQRSVVEHILCGSSGTAPYLVHGPPGTGKTVTIVEAILQLVYKNPNNRIMVCTDSNMAADHVATVLIKYADNFIQKDHLLLRANSEFRTWESLPESLHKYSNGHSRYTFKKVDIATFKSYSIVITTLSHAAKFANDLKRKGKKRYINYLFVDEAAQASEPACLVPVCGLLAPHGSLVLAGDPLQLGPVVISHDARGLGLGLSLMERLKTTCDLYSDECNDPNYIVMLRTNFRSNQDILDIPNDMFYKGLLLAHASADPISYMDILGESATSRAIVFHGVLSKEQKMGKSPSFFNTMELEVVQKYIIALITRHKVLPEDIGVVTPYIRQVYKIKNWLSTQNFGANRIEVGTVEAFQGKEKRVIVISTVRANCGLLDHDAKFQLGFLVDDKRFNVALTRAKAKAIVIGNPLCLQVDAKWRQYIQKCRELGTYYGYDSLELDRPDVKKDIVDNITPILKELKLSKSRV